MADKVTIKEVRTYSTSKKGGGDYHLQEKRTLDYRYIYFKSHVHVSRIQKN